MKTVTEEEFAKALEVVPSDSELEARDAAELDADLAWLPSYLDTVYGKRPIRGPHE